MECKHGKRVRREGTSAKGPWVAHFCSQPKDSSDQCAPIWGDTEDTRPATPSSAATDLLSSIDSKLTVVVELLRDLSTRDIKF